MSKLKKGDNQADHGWQCDRVIYGEDGEFEVYAVREAGDGYQPWRMRLMCPSAGASKSGVAQSAHWTSESLMDPMQPMLRRIRSTYGGCWYLDIRNHTEESDDRIVPARTQERSELRRSLDNLMRPGRPPVRNIERPRELYAGDSHSDFRDEPKPLPTRDLSHIPSPPKADAAWFDAETKKLAESERQ